MSDCEPTLPSRLPRSVLFVNRVFPPDRGATGQLLGDLTRGLVRLGWNVHVLAGPGDPATSDPGPIVHRVPALKCRHAGLGRRALGYASLYPSLLARGLALPRPDAVVTMTDPPLQLALGPLLKARYRCRLVHWAQDLYPELAEQMEVIRPRGAVAGLLRACSNWALRRSDAVLAVGRCMEERLVARGVAPGLIRVVPNWAPAGLRPPESSRVQAFRHAQGWSDRHVMMYSGNLGLAHTFDAILAAAQELQRRLPRALFVFVGDGPRLRWLRDQAGWRGLKNVQFLPPQPLETLGVSMAAADIHLASMREELSGLVVPSKVYGILAAGRPCVFLGPSDSEVARVLRARRCGSVVAPNDYDGLTSELLEWFFDLNRYQEGCRLAAFAARHATAEHAVEAFHRVLQALLTGPATEGLVSAHSVARRA